MICGLGRNYGGQYRGTIDLVTEAHDAAEAPPEWQPRV